MDLGTNFLVIYHQDAHLDAPSKDAKLSFWSLLSNFDKKNCHGKEHFLNEWTRAGKTTEKSAGGNFGEEHDYLEYGIQHPHI